MQFVEDQIFTASTLFAGRSTYAKFYKADFTNSDKQYTFLAILIVGALFFATQTITGG